MAEIDAQRGKQMRKAEVVGARGIAAVVDFGLKIFGQRRDLMLIFG